MGQSQHSYTASSACKFLDYSLPLVEYGTFDTVRRVSGALGSSVPVDNVEINTLAPNVGDVATVPFEFVGLNGCTIPAEAIFTRLTAGNQSTTLNTVASLIFNLGADDWRVTLRALPDIFGNVPEFDFTIMPSQMAGAEQFVIQLGVDTPPDDYLRGGGAPAVNLPLTANLVWGNGNNTGHSAFRYNGVREVTFRLNGLNARSNVTSFGLLNGPSLVEIEGKEGLLDFLIDRLGSDLAAPTGITATTPTLPAAQGKVVTDFFSEGNQGPFQLQVRNVTNGTVIWEALIMNAPYSVIPNLQGASVISTVNPDGSFQHLLTGDVPLGPFASVTVSGGSPIPSGTGANVEFFCEAA